MTLDMAAGSAPPASALPPTAKHVATEPPRTPQDEGGPKHRPTKITAASGEPSVAGKTIARDGFAATRNTKEHEAAHRLDGRFEAERRAAHAGSHDVQPIGTDGDDPRDALPEKVLATFHDPLVGDIEAALLPKHRHSRPAMASKRRA